MRDPVELQGAKIIAVAQIGEQLIEDRPGPFAAGNSKLTIEMAHDIVLNAVVVEQRIVNIDQENDSIR